LPDRPSLAYLPCSTASGPVDGIVLFSPLVETAKLTGVTTGVFGQKNKVSSPASVGVRLRIVRNDAIVDNCRFSSHRREYVVTLGFF